MPRLTIDQWAEARAIYEAGASQSDVARRFGVARAAVAKRIERDGWKQDLEPAIRRRVAGVIAERDAKRTEAAIEAEAEKRADVIERHRRDWGPIRADLEAAMREARAAVTLEDRRRAFERLKAIKIATECIAIRHAGERRAWKLDDPNADPKEDIEIVVTW